MFFAKFAPLLTLKNLFIIQATMKRTRRLESRNDSSAAPSAGDPVTQPAFNSLPT